MTDQSAEIARLSSLLEVAREALKVAAKAELYDLLTGIIDADVLDIVQSEAAAALAQITPGAEGKKSGAGEGLR